MGKILRLIKNFLLCLKTGSKPVQVTISQIVYEKMFEGKIEYNSNLNFGETEKLTKKLK